MGAKLKGIQDLFSLLCRSAAELNSLLSMPVLYFVTSRIITATVCLFILISPYTVSPEYLPSVRQYGFGYLILEVMFPSVILIGLVLAAADWPVQEVIISYLPSSWLRWLRLDFRIRWLSCTQRSCLFPGRWFKTIVMRYRYHRFVQSTFADWSFCVLKHDRKLPRWCTSSKTGFDCLLAACSKLASLFSPRWKYHSSSSAFNI